MKPRKHLNYNELLKLYLYISKGYSINYIASLLNCNKSTIYRVIHKHREFHTGQTIFASKYYKNCMYINECKNNKIYRCPSNCPKFKKYECEKLREFPYICDFCSKKNSCLKDKYTFNPEKAYAQRVMDNRESKKGPQVKNSVLKRFDEFIAPLIKKGLSIETIESEYKESFPVSSRQVRNWIDNKVFGDLSRADLINAQKRDYKKEYSYDKISKNPLIKVGRTYECYLKFQEDTNIIDRFEIDTVHGKQKDRISILTIHFPRFKFQFGFILDGCTSFQVNKVFNDIKEKIGKNEFIKMFKVLLSDNGPEFDRLHELEIDPDTNEEIIKVFFTRPYSSGDKGSCEKNHELFRYFIKKGESLNDLTQNDLDYMFSNINSYPRKSLNYKTPYELMTNWFKEDIINKLGIKKIEFKDLVMKKINKKE